jgi:hypothetical protein
MESFKKLSGDVELFKKWSGDMELFKKWEGCSYHERATIIAGDVKQKPRPKPKPKDKEFIKEDELKL